MKNRKFKTFLIRFLRMNSVMCMRSGVVTPNLLIKTTKLKYNVSTFAKNARADNTLFFSPLTNGMDNTVTALRECGTETKR